jgi:hypothetical protein
MSSLTETCLQDRSKVEFVDTCYEQNRIGSYSDTVSTGGSPMDGEDEGRY